MGAFRSLEITRNLMLILDEFKGQIFSKGLFGVLEFSQKNKGSNSLYVVVKTNRSFVFGENPRIPKVPLKLSDL